MFTPVGVDLFQSSSRVDHIAAHPDSSLQKWLQAYPERQDFFFCVNFQLPGPTQFSIAIYFMRDGGMKSLEDSPGILSDSTSSVISTLQYLYNIRLRSSLSSWNSRVRLECCVDIQDSFSRVWTRFLAATDDEKSKRVKLIPSVAEGPFLVISYTCP